MERGSGTNHDDRRDSRQESKRKARKQVRLLAFTEDYAMKTKAMLLAARDRRKWKAMTTHAHDGHGT